MVGQESRMEEEGLQVISWPRRAFCGKYSGTEKRRRRLEWKGGERNGTKQKIL